MSIESVAFLGTQARTTAVKLEEKLDTMKATLDSILLRIDMAGFNFTRWSPSGDYNISMVGEYLHRIPHLDIKLRPINATFDPHDNE